MTASITWAQDLPANPEPGKCYVRCTTPDVYVNETITLTVKPAYKVLKTVPATFKTVTERVEVKAAGKKLTDSTGSSSGSTGSAQKKQQ